MKRKSFLAIAVCLILLSTLPLSAAALATDGAFLLKTADSRADYMYQTPLSSDGRLQELPATRLQPLLVDDADLLTDSEKSRLQMKLEKASEDAGVDIAVVTKNDIGGKDIQTYADDYYDYNGYGRGENHDGVLLLLSMAERDYWITTTGYCIEAITDYGIDTMILDMLSDLSNGDYYEAFETFATECADMVSQSRSGNVYDYYTNADDSFGYGGYYDDALKQYNQQSSGFNYGGAAVIAVVIGFALALITAFAMKGKLKTVRHQYEASNYVVPGSLQMKNQEDRFLYASVSKTQIASDNNHSSGGHSSLSGGGSSVHVGSSGVPHGGGGGKF